MGHAGPYHITRALRSRVNQELQEASFVITRGLNDLWLLQEDGLTCLNSFTGWHEAEDWWEVVGPADRRTSGSGVGEWGVVFLSRYGHIW